MTSVTTDRVIREILQEVRNVYRKNGRFTDGILSSLNYIFKAPLAGAFSLLDKNAVTKVTSQPSGRVLYKVTGSSGLPYICMPSSNYCSCPSYKFSVLVTQDYPVCKHSLAVHLALATANYKEVNYADSTLTVMLEELE